MNINNVDMNDPHDENAVILEIQQRLRILYKAGYDIPQINPDGVYGDKTNDTVKAYQKILGLEQTGVVDYKLWLRLYKASEREKNTFS